MNGMIDRIRQIFTHPDEVALFKEEVDVAASPADKYQKAMQLVLDCRGE